MATIPDWKLQLLARRRQEEAAARGREQAERERLSQMPAWKRGLLERRRAKLGLPPGEPSPAAEAPEAPEAAEAPETAEAGPPEPDEPAVLREAIGPVQQNRFIRQERQQRTGEPPADRRPGPAQTHERRPSPGEPPERRLGVGGAREPSPRPLEARDWRPSPGESPRLSEGQRWRLSPGEAGSQRLGLVEAHKRRPGPGEAPEEASEWRLSAEERNHCLEDCGRKGERPVPGVTPEEIPGPSETPSGVRDGSPRGTEAAERRPGPAGDGERGWRPTEGWKWTLSSGKAREWTPRDTEAQKPEPFEPPEVEVGELEAEKEAGAQGRTPGALQQRPCAVPSPLPPEDAGTRGPQRQEEEAAEPRPPPAAPLSPPPPGDPLMSRLFYGVKAGPGVGPPRRSGHTFTVNPRRSVPPAAPALPAADAVAPGAGKKRYPTAEEILVLGGYLRLSRSCLAKGSPERHHKQLKISFSETALETTYQYPSESSVLEELGPEPEPPSAASPPAAQPDDEDEEEELLLLQRELQGGLRTKALLVDESCRR